MSTVAAFPTQAENWLDERGKGAWIAAMILSFIFFWPAGLALLIYMIWSKRMFSRNCAERITKTHNRTHRATFRSSGNTAFDSYKADTLRRLEEEQENFESFLQRLRESKDKSEFDQFMDERAKNARNASADDADKPNDADNATAGY